MSGIFGKDIELEAALFKHILQGSNPTLMQCVFE